MKRITSFQDGAQNTLEEDYQGEQGLLAFATGSVLGKGFGHSQQKLFFLPDAHTDFIMAIVGEEMGFVGSSFVLLLFVVLFSRGIMIAWRSGTRFKRLLALGLTLSLFCQTVLNLLVVTRLAPTTGQPLPFSLVRRLEPDVQPDPRRHPALAVALDRGAAATRGARRAHGALRQRHSGRCGVHDAMSARPPRIMIAAGGTGGHLFPGIAVAEALRARGLTELLFVSAGKGNWREALDKAGFPWRSLPVRGFGRRPSLAHLAFPFRLAAGIALSLSLIASFRPAAVVGTGGYVSGPVVAAAWLLGVPVLLLEQNAFPGVATRIASQFAREIHLAYPGSESFLPPGARAKARITGNPIRGGVLRADRAAARAALGLAGDIPTLFLLGGSQGAVALNRALSRGAGPLGARARRVDHGSSGHRADRRARRARLEAGFRRRRAPRRAAVLPRRRRPVRRRRSARLPRRARRRSPRSRRSASRRSSCPIRSPPPIIKRTTPSRWRARAPRSRFPSAT